MTRSKQSATDSHPEPEENTATGSKVAKERAYWSADDEIFFATFLLEHKAEAGDGANFKNKTFADAGKELDARKKKGGSKTVDACKSKWSRVRNSISILVSNNGTFLLDQGNISSCSYSHESIWLLLGTRYRGGC
jgi:hypothetical protein